MSLLILAVVWIAVATSDSIEEKCTDVVLKKTPEVENHYNADVYFGEGTPKIRKVNFEGEFLQSDNSKDACYLRFTKSDERDILVIHPREEGGSRQIAVYGEILEGNIYEPFWQKLTYSTSSDMVGDFRIEIEATQIPAEYKITITINNDAKEMLYNYNNNHQEWNSYTLGSIDMIKIDCIGNTPVMKVSDNTINFCGGSCDKPGNGGIWTAQNVLQQTKLPVFEGENVKFGCPPEWKKESGSFVATCESGSNYDTDGVIPVCVKVGSAVVKIKKRKSVTKDKKSGKKFSILCQLKLKNVHLEDPEDPTNVCWYKIVPGQDPMKITAETHGEKFRFKKKKGTYSLQFVSPTPEESGTYRCQFEKDYIVASTDVTVNVKMM